MYVETLQLVVRQVKGDKLLVVVGKGYAPQHIASKT